MDIKIFFFFFKGLFIFRVWGREQGRERNINSSVASHAPPAGEVNPPPRHVSCPGITPATFWFVGQRWTHWARPARAGCQNLGSLWNCLYIASNLLRTPTTCSVLTGRRRIRIQEVCLHWNFLTRHVIIDAAVGLDAAVQLCASAGLAGAEGALISETCVRT